MEGQGVQPGLADELLRHAQKCSLTAGADVNGGARLTLDVLLDIQLAAQMGWQSAGHISDAAAAGAGQRLDQPARIWRQVGGIAEVTWAR